MPRIAPRILFHGAFTLRLAEGEGAREALRPPQHRNAPASQRPSVPQRIEVEELLLNRP
ncbi:hypothetical protein [Bradyrhizobium sp. RP6]|uniref:hypothetical protein n=1 Tax=Bradyrhizobium sp. RP6 TaxID=2489596 RepID=UPI001315678E|nr:hypothetical protein [Bradyrhizobium sp. RP6]